MPLTTDSRLEYLFKRYFDKKNTPEEAYELFALLDQAQYDDQLKYLMDQAWTRLSPAYRISDEQSERILSGMLSSFSRKEPSQGAFRRRMVRWSAVAATILALLAAGWLWHENISKKKLKGVAVVAGSNNRISPGGNKAVLILGNGSSVILDSAHNGIVAHQGKMRILKLNGQVSYQGQGEKNMATVYNTIVTPRGGQYQVILPDGSRVWLNAASSLRFPTAFAGTERAVALTGEAYFEVATDKDMPFKVSVAGMEVKVLGTHFNIMAYHDEPAITTTLLEGSVEISKGNNVVRLRPGQQASLGYNDHPDIEVDAADTEAATAWKDGLFLFRNTDIRAVLREIARWYNTNVIYDGNINAHLNGMISRTTDLPQVLHMLEVTSGIKFTITGTNIIVTPPAGEESLINKQ